MGFFSKRKAASKAATDEVDAWLNTANEAAEHDALDMVDVESALGGVMPAPPAPDPTAATAVALETFDPTTMADILPPADNPGELWHFPELDDTEPSIPVERRAPSAPVADVATPAAEDQTAAPSSEGLSPAPSMFDMLASLPPETEEPADPQLQVEGESHPADPRPEIESSSPMGADEPDPLGDVALTTGGDMEDVWATFDALSPAPESDALDDLWGKKDRRAPEAAITPSPEAAAAPADPFATADETPAAVVDFAMPEPDERLDLGDPATFSDAVVDFDAPSGPSLDDSAAFLSFETGGNQPATLDEAPVDEAEAVVEELAMTDAVIEIDPVFGPLPVPVSPQTELLLEILGLEPGCDWSEVRYRRAALLQAHAPSTEDDDERAALALDIRHEMNSAYAALRLYFVA